MFIGTNGIVVDNKGRVLLIRRDDMRTWAIPGGALDAGELPTDGVAREVKEETGLEVVPARLVGLYFWADGTVDSLILTFRCLIEGGKMAISEESPRVEFVSSESLPTPTLAIHKERLERGLSHTDDTPYWGVQHASLFMIVWRRAIGPLVYALKDLSRRLRGEPPFQPPLPWSSGAFVIVRDDSGDVLWVKRNDYDVWNLPGGGSEQGEAPWETAVRETREETGLEVALTGCSGVYVKPATNTMILIFTASIIGGSLTTGPESTAFDYFTPGCEPDNSLPKHVERVADAEAMPGPTRFKVQDGPPGLEILGLDTISGENKPQAPAK
jgi:8-oxo-dGTP pyrophosphatase MutT (NUDIX family)